MEVCGADTVPEVTMGVCHLSDPPEPRSGFVIDQLVPLSNQY